MPMVVIKRGDTRTAIKASLRAASGAAVDLTDSAVRFLLVDLQGASKIDRYAEVVDATAGKVLVAVTAPEVDAPGLYRAEFEVTFGDGRVETYPNSGYVVVKIIPDLG